MAVELNECLISGTIIEEPQFSGEGDGAWAFLKIMTSFGMQKPDGGWTDAEQIVPIVADAANHVNTVRKYMKAGKAMTVSGYYRSWESNGPQHGFFVRKFIFSKPNWGADQGGQGGNKYPSMPKT
jgi:hypothetical protein